MGEQVMPEIDAALCILCGYCIAACPVGALSRTERGICLDERLCAYCGDCEAVCPNGAISLPYEIRMQTPNAADPSVMPAAPKA